MTDRVDARIADLEAENARLREQLDDWQSSARVAAGESCGDEVHCTCVPLLRMENARLRKLACWQEDDAEPVTDAWLRDQRLLILDGIETEDGEEHLGRSFTHRCTEQHIGIVEFANAWQAIITADCGGEVYVGDMETRGQLRRLIAALEGK